MDNYEINRSTYAIIPTENSFSTVLAEDNNYTVEKLPTKIVDDSCKNFGSSLNGRQEGTKKLINISYKAPIIVCETSEIIFFPTSSPRFKDCMWISLNNIKNYYKEDNYTVLEFKNGKKLKLEVSFYTVENQIFKATMLASKLFKLKQEK